MKNLFAIFKKSLYNPLFYREVAEAPLGDAFRYYVRLTGNHALFSVIVFSIVLVPQGVRFMKESAPSLVKEYYPAELVVTIKNSEAEANVPQPYFIAGGNSVRPILKDAGFENILVIDTTRDFNKKTFEEYKTFALLTKTEVVTQNERGRITIQSLQGMPELTIDQTALLQWVEKVRAMLVFIVPIGVSMVLLALFSGYMAYLLPLLLFALIPFFLAWMRKVPLTYGGAYKMSMYAVVPGLVLKTIFNVGGFFFVPAYLSLLVFTLIIFLNMREVEQPTLFSGRDKE
ncbi:MAG: DUF1189 family protein [Minisyncoccota bacterium]